MIYTMEQSPCSKSVESHYIRLVKMMEREQAHPNRWNNLKSFERRM